MKTISIYPPQLLIKVNCFLFGAEGDWEEWEDREDWEDWERRGGRLLTLAPLNGNTYGWGKREGGRAVRPVGWSEL